MVPRYTPEDVGALWSEAHKLETWLRVELAATEAMAQAGLVPAEDLAALQTSAKTVDFEALAKRADEIEKTTKHDVIAFLTAFEELAGPPSRHIHFGLTSSDVLDTALALVLCEAVDLIQTELGLLADAIRKRAQEHRRTPMMGRSHGIHGEPISFGFVLAGWFTEVRRSQARLASARAEIAFGKLSGAMGTSAHFPPALEKAALAKLGLEVEPVATQVVPRDRHAQLFSTLAIIGASIERFSVEVRHLQRTEVYEAEEPFTVGQKGSSAMPHKRNPILTENLTGLARLVRMSVVPAMENVALWHERDISHSSVERAIGPDTTITLDFALNRLAGVIEKLVIYPENMLKNMNKFKGLVMSQRVLLALTQAGVSREDSYRLVQRNAMKVWEKGADFLEELLGESGSARRTAFGGQVVEIGATHQASHRVEVKPGI